MDNQNSSLFWDITPCSPLKIKRRFRGSYPSFFKVKEKAKQDISEKQVASRGLISHCFFVFLFLDVEDDGAELYQLSTDYTVLYPRTVRDCLCENLKSFE
jgi:hypothetical protein